MSDTKYLYGVRSFRIFSIDGGSLVSLLCLFKLNRKNWSK